MPYNNIYKTNLNEIITLVKAKQITGENQALAKFTSYINIIEDIGPFNTNEWKADWRKVVYEFGEEFKSTSPQLFLQIIDNKLSEEDTINKEAIEFIRSEIAINFLPDTECKKQLEKLIERFPLNPEFRHTLGHYYWNEKDGLKAIQQYKLAIKIDSTNNTFISSRFEMDQNYLNHLIGEGKFEIAHSHLTALFNEQFYKPIDPHYHNAFVDFKCRLDDHSIFQKQLTSLASEFREKMHSELESERKRIIEVLGFFSAIVAFILATVSIGKSFSFLETVYFILALGIILILFAVTLSILFNSSKKKLFEDKKFWILVIGLFFMLLLIISTDTISVLVSKFTS
jgi:tetratricopeptide (TPR) repeat protein